MHKNTLSPIPGVIHRWNLLLIAMAFAVSTAAHAQAKEAFTLTSPAFQDKATIPDQYTCRGADISPPLHIENVPDGTKSLALTVHDIDGVTGTWVHWVVFNMPAHTVDIAEKDILGIQALNDFGNFYYGGPCPPDHKSHHYIFTLYALREILTEVDEGATMDTLQKAMQGKILGQAALTGLYQKTNW